MSNIDKEIKIFCENLKYLRKEKGLSKKEMAKKLGIGVQSLSVLESGRLPPRLSLEPLFNIHKNFGISSSEIFCEDFCRQTD